MKLFLFIAGLVVTVIGLRLVPMGNDALLAGLVLSGIGVALVFFSLRMDYEDTFGDK